jgi:hypothetical protein
VPEEYCEDFYVKKTPLKPTLIEKVSLIRTPDSILSRILIFTKQVFKSLLKYLPWPQVQSDLSFS